MRKSHFTYLLLLLFCGLIAATEPQHLVSNDGLTAQEQAGKKIYTKGIGSSEEKVMANMSGVDVPATVLPCANCHNADGTGTPEGGVVPSNITWSELTKSYGGKRNGKKHPAYTEQSLRKAITMGIDPGGNKLHAAMPKYNMSRTDLDNLVAYIKTLGAHEDSGLNNTPIKIGVALSNKNGTASELNETIKKTINAYCDRVNKNGGIYNRNLQAEYFYTNKKTEAPQNCIAITGFGLQNEATAIADYAKASETPSLLAFSQGNSTNGLNNPYVFYIYPSLSAQGKSLVNFSQKSGLTKNAIVIYQDDPTRKTIANEIAKHYTKVAGKTPEVVSISNNIETIVSAKNTTSETLIFYIGPSNIGDQLVNAFDKIGKHPSILVPGSLSSINVFKLPQAFKNKVYIAYPTWVTERTLAGLSIYQSLKNEYQLGNQYKNSQLDAIAVIMTMEECFKRVGKKLTKEKMLKAMEGLYEYRTGLTPPVTYNINQRVGSNNIYITAFDEKKEHMELVGTINCRE
jgi:ABC-type branched-subunit amino acid transport system substrate-binding protein/cytochrome c553